MTNAESIKLKEARIPRSWKELRSYQLGQLVRVRHLSTYISANYALILIDNKRIGLAQRLNLKPTGSGEVFVHKGNIRFNDDALGIYVRYHDQKWVDIKEQEYTRILPLLEGAGL